MNEPDPLEESVLATVVSAIILVIAGGVWTLGLLT